MSKASVAMFAAGQYVGQYHCFEEMAASSDSWDQVYRQPVAGAFNAHSRIAQTHSLQLSFDGFYPGVIINGMVKHACYTFCLPLGQHEQIYSMSQKVLPQQIIVGKPGEEFAFRALHACEALVLCVEQTRLEAYAHAQFHCSIEDLKLPRLLALAPSNTGASLINQWHWLLQQSQLNPQQLREPLCAFNFEQHALSLLPLQEKIAHQVPLASRRKKAIQIEAFLRAHPNQRFSIDQLCQQFNTTARSLRQGFIECFGMPPKQVQTMLQLNFTYQQLATGTSLNSITELTAKANINELGRFSVAYKKLFGESPKYTLKHRQ